MSLEGRAYSLSPSGLLVVFPSHSDSNLHSFSHRLHSFVGGLSDKAPGSWEPSRGRGAPLEMEGTPGYFCGPRCDPHPPRQLQSE